MSNHDTTDESSWNSFIVAARAVLLFLGGVGVLATGDRTAILSAVLLILLVLFGLLLGRWLGTDRF